MFSHFIKGATLALVGLAGLALAGLSPAHSRALEGTDLQSTVLNNGLTVAVVEDHRAERVAVNLCFTVGSFDEPLGKGGLAHAFEHSWFNGSRNLPEGEYSAYLSRRGSLGINAFTMQDRTCYVVTVATRYLGDALWLYGETWANLELNDARFQKERGAIIAERQMRTDNNPQARFFEKFGQYHLPNHPYGRPIIGSMDDINGWVLADLQNWFQTNYVPNNAYLVLVGDVTLEGAKALANQHFNNLEAGTPPFINNGYAEPKWTAPKRMPTVVDAQAGNPIMVRQYRVGGYFAGLAGEAGDPEFSINLALAVRLMSEGQTAYLHRRLVLEEQKALHVSVGYSSQTRSEASMTVYGIPAPGVTLAEMEKAIDAALADWLAEPRFTQADLDRLKTKTMAALEFSKDSVGSASRGVGNYLSAGGDPANYNRWIALQDAATIDTVMAAAQAAFDINQSTTAYLTPRAELTGEPNNE